MAVEHVLKGKEIRLPPPLSYFDRDGHERHDVRVRWFESHVGKTWREYAFGIEADFPSDKVPPNTLAAPYPTDAPPVVFGHYWLSAASPQVLAPNVACVDYSVAKHGHLCAYCFDGESTLSNENFAWVKAASQVTRTQLHCRYLT